MYVYTYIHTYIHTHIHEPMCAARGGERIWAGSSGLAGIWDIPGENERFMDFVWGTVVGNV